MSDGVRLAVDVYLPQMADGLTRVPTILFQTRYYRDIEFRWPFSRLIRVPWVEQAFFFGMHGYAFVILDTRGSGASFGHRVSDLSSRETKDGTEIVDWITSQPWSDGTVAAYGDSYAGAAAVMLVAQGHPSVKALAALNSPYDFYCDIALPGGITWVSFNQLWSKTVEGLDQNRLEGLLPKLLIKGVRPVDADGSRDMLRNAIQYHKQNYKYFEALKQITYRDDPFGEQTLETISPCGHFDKIRAANIPAYILTGWFDVFGPNAGIRLFANSPHSDSRLTIGPWTHGFGRIQPGYKLRSSHFEWKIEILKFFNKHLRGDPPAKKADPIHYWTVIEEKWKSTKEWPPPQTSFLEYFLCADQKLDLQSPANNPIVSQQVQQWSVNKNKTRWAQPWKSRLETLTDRSALHYETEMLDADCEVTGRPTLMMFIGSSTSNDRFFVYLEDIDKEGKSRYVTEGLLHALHLKRAPIIDKGSELHSFHRIDETIPESNDFPIEVAIDLFPISYLFLSGHRIGISLSGSDLAHFDEPVGHVPAWRVYHGAKHPSRLLLPQMLRCSTTR